MNKHQAKRRRSDRSGRARHLICTRQCPRDGKAHCTGWCTTRQSILQRRSQRRCLATFPASTLTVIPVLCSTSTTRNKAESQCFTFVGQIIDAAMVESMVDHGRAMWSIVADQDRARGRPWSTTMTYTMTGTMGPWTVPPTIPCRPWSIMTSLIDGPMGPSMDEAMTDTWSITAGAVDDLGRPWRRSTIEVHPNFSEAPHLRSSMPLPKTYFS